MMSRPTAQPMPAPGAAARRSRRWPGTLLLALLAIASPASFLACGGDPPDEEAGAGAERPVVGEEATAPSPDADPGEAAATDEPPGEPEPEGAPPAGTPPSEPARVSPAETHIFQVVVDGGEGAPQPETFGCGDRLRAVATPIATDGLDTAGRIAAALEELFSAPAVGGLHTAFADSELTVEQVTPVAGVEGLFRVELAGQLRVGGVCDHPRVRAQIEATARQFEGVAEVEVLIDGESLDALLTGRGR